MKCSICKSELTLKEITILCDCCKKTFHKDCWDINKGCGTPGCKNIPVKEEKQIEEEYTYFGAQTKICPVCSETIPITAEKCLFCNEEFDSVIPQTQEQFKKKFEPESLYRSQKHTAFWILIGGIIGCLSPINLLFGLPWFFKNRITLKNNLPLQYILCIVSFCLSAFYVLLFMIAIIVKST